MRLLFFTKGISVNKRLELIDPINKILETYFPGQKIFYEIADIGQTVSSGPSGMTGNNSLEGILIVGLDNMESDEKRQLELDMKNATKYATRVVGMF